VTHDAVAYVLADYGAAPKREGRPTPSPGPGEILVRVRACGVCATDVKAFSGALPEISLGRVLGHEIAGVVAQTGHGVAGIEVGTRVCLYGRDPCKRCAYCVRGSENICAHQGPRLGFERDGGFADYVLAPADSAYPIGGLSFEAGAILTDAVATAVHAVMDRGKVNENDSVLVISAGGVGIHVSQIAHARGATVVVADPNTERLAVANELGLATWELTKQGNEWDALVKKHEPRAIFDCFGMPDPSDLINALPMDSRIIAVGYYPDNFLRVPQMTLVRKELTLVGARAQTPLNLAEAIRLVQDGLVVPIIDDVRPMTEISEALIATADHAGRGRKILVNQPLLITAVVLRRDICVHAHGKGRRTPRVCADNVADNTRFVQ